MKIPPPKKLQFPVLSEVSCLAKTYRGEAGIDVLSHLQLCTIVLRELLRLFQDTPRDFLLKKDCEYLAALHDIGKVTPGFQQKIYRAMDKSPSLGPAISNADHAEYSGWILRGKYGDQFARLVAAHHGVMKKLGNKAVYNDLAEICGGENWSTLRQTVCRDVLNGLGLDFEYIPEIDSRIEMAVLGAVIVADWISSGIELPWGTPITGVDAATFVRAAGFQKSTVRKGLTFEEIFGFQPNELQAKCIAPSAPGGIIVIESEMGSGKTEAALYLAYSMLESGNANGIYFALPTQLTSEKIYARLNSFLGKILPDEEQKKTLLIHGDAWLEWNMDLDDDGSAGNADSWFQSKKRALLAPFGAGTVDQALLAVLNVKHNSVRAFALSGKVVIIDECHSYDHYTGFLLKELICALRNYGCTVILLSATLTAAARRELAQLQCGESVAYPLITGNFPGDKYIEIPFEGQAPREVTVDFAAEDDALAAALEKANSGEQVLWIENTVKKAQEIFQKLSTCPPDIEIGLIHSRFPRCMRSISEEKWVELLGKHGVEERKKCGRILVGTQVLEQSVDIDADLLISRIAPMDMLFQRMGRLWRHRALDKFRPDSAERKVLIIRETVLDNAGNVEEKSFLPYEAYHICRTHEVLSSRSAFLLPADIRPALEQVYAERNETGRLQILKDRMVVKKEGMQRLAVLASREVNEPEDDDTVSTRLNERPSVQLLLLKKNNDGRSLAEELLSPFCDEPILLDKTCKVKTVRRLMQTLITVPEDPDLKYDDFSADFAAPFLYIGNDGCRPLRVAYLDQDGYLLDRACNRLPFFFHQKLGVIKEK